MNYQFKFHPYQRPFKTPLKTAHGTWEKREGIIFCLIDETEKQMWGEIAPLSWFGSETLQQALEFCQQLPPLVSSEIILSIPNHLPACQFGFESAILPSQAKQNLLKISGLLPTGHTALKNWKPLFIQGYQTLKWKIAVASVQEELTIFQQLIENISNTLTPLKQKVFLRLDANAGLNLDQAEQWLEICDKINSSYFNCIEIEFIEQPLSINQFKEMLKLCDRYSTPIALDESVATLQQLKDCYQQGWSEIFIIKPSIIGSPTQLKSFCQNHPIDAVFSSVLETSINQQAAFNLAQELSFTKRALGFGVNHWFIEDETTWLTAFKQKF